MRVSITNTQSAKVSNSFPRSKRAVKAPVIGNAWSAMPLDESFLGRKAIGLETRNATDRTSVFHVTP